MDLESVQVGRQVFHIRFYIVEQEVVAVASRDCQPRQSSLVGYLAYEVH